MRDTAQKELESIIDEMITSLIHLKQYLQDYPPVTFAKQKGDDSSNLIGMFQKLENLVSPVAKGDKEKAE